MNLDCCHLLALCHVSATELYMAVKNNCSSVTFSSPTGDIEMIQASVPLAIGTRLTLRAAYKTMMDGCDVLAVSSQIPGSVIFMCVSALSREK